MRGGHRAMFHVKHAGGRILLNPISRMPGRRSQYLATQPFQKPKKSGVVSDIQLSTRIIYQEYGGSLLFL